MTDFVSGLERPPLPIAHPRGIEMLGHIRALARDEIDRLDPVCHDRFDGVERLPADEQAIAQRKVYRGILAMVDEVSADIAMARRIAARLATLDLIGEGRTR